VPAARSVRCPLIVAVATVPFWPASRLKRRVTYPVLQALFKLYLNSAQSIHCTKEKAIFLLYHRRDSELMAIGESPPVRFPLPPARPSVSWVVIGSFSAQTTQTMGKL